MIEILSSIKNTFLILLIIFFTVFCLILLTRLVFMVLFHFAKKRYEALKRANPFKKKDIKKYNKEEEELLRNIEIPVAHSKARANNLGANKSETYELMVSQEQQMSKNEMNNINIVDVIKPVGFWTSVILGQKLTYLIQSAQIINKRGQKGFWVSMIEAQEQAAGKQHSRGR